MEWLGVWNCIFSGSEFSNLGENLSLSLSFSLSLSLSLALQIFRDFSGKFGLLEMLVGLWKMAIPYATNPYPH